MRDDGVGMSEHKCCVQTREKGNVLGNDCVADRLLGGNACPCVGTLSTVKCWNHLVMDMNAGAMISRGRCYGLDSGFGFNAEGLELGLRASASE